MKNSDKLQLLSEQPKFKTFKQEIQIVILLIERIRFDKMMEALPEKMMMAIVGSWLNHFDTAKIPIERVMSIYLRAIELSKTGFIAPGDMIQTWKIMKAEAAEAARIGNPYLYPNNCPKCFGQLFVKGEKCSWIHHPKFYLPVRLNSASVLPETESSEPVVENSETSKNPTKMRVRHRGDKTKSGNLTHDSAVSQNSQIEPQNTQTESQNTQIPVLESVSAFSEVILDGEYIDIIVTPTAE